MELIYVASPYAGDVEQNVENAKEYCRYVMEQGGVPLPSHLLYPQMLDDSSPAQRGLGTRMGLELLARCDGLWAFGEISPGMEAEMAEAERLGIPVRQVTMEELEENRMSGKYGIIASRSAASVCGAATAWLKNDGEPVEFETYAQAAEEAHRLNTQSRSPNVSYYPKQMPELSETMGMGMRL